MLSSRSAYTLSPFTPCVAEVRSPHEVEVARTLYVRAQDGTQHDVCQQVAGIVGKKRERPEPLGPSRPDPYYASMSSDEALTALAGLSALFAADCLSASSLTATT